MLTKLFHYFDSSNYTLLLFYCFFLFLESVILYMRYYTVHYWYDSLNVTFIIKISNIKKTENYMHLIALYTV
jgi:hypothetical protein